MKFYTKKIVNRKMIKIMFQEDEGSKPELMAIVPYKGHCSSFECMDRTQLANCIMEFLKHAKKESRRTIGETMKVLSIGSPWVNVLEDNI